MVPILIISSSSPNTMRPKLLKSFIFVVVFWFAVTSIYWSAQADTSIAFNAVERVSRLIPDMLDSPHEFSRSIFSAIFVQKYIITYWTLPVLILSGVSFLIGFALLWRRASIQLMDRAARESGTGSFRGLSITLGVLPAPNRPSKEIFEVAGVDNPLSGLPDSHRALLLDVLGILAANSDCYNKGLSVSILESAITLVDKALLHPKYPGLSAIVAASGDLGLLTSWKKSDNGEWSPIPNKNVDKESAKALSTLDSWFNLPALEKNAILMAVRFKSTPKLIPNVGSDPEVFRLAKDLLFFAEDVEQKVASEERQKTLENSDLPSVILDAFLKSLPLLSFQHKGLPKGVQAVAWKVGKRVYMLEIKLRDTMSSKLPPEIKNSLLTSSKERARVQPFTAELLKALHAKGWLVTETDSLKVNPKEALWNIKAGKLEFKGVIILDIPDELISQLPAGDSMYDVAVSGTLFSVSTGDRAVPSPGASGISKADLLGSVLNEVPAKQPLV